MKIADVQPFNQRFTDLGARNLFFKDIWNCSIRTNCDEGGEEAPAYISDPHGSFFWIKKDPKL